MIHSLRDKIFNTSRHSVAKGTMTLLNNLQEMPQDVQIMVSATLFRCLCRVYEQDPAELLQAIDNLMNQAKLYDHRTFNAVEVYIENELKETNKHA